MGMLFGEKKLNAAIDEPPSGKKKLVTFEFADERNLSYGLGAAGWEVNLTAESAAGPTRTGLD